MAPPKKPLLPLLTPKPAERRDRRGARSGESLQGLYQRIKEGLPERRKFRERRASPRVAVGLELEARHGSERTPQTTNDLSTFGLSVLEGPTPPTGTKLTLALFLPDEPMSPLELEGVVLGPCGANGMRVKFHQPSLEAVRRIHRYLSGVKP